jgi:uncharacterized membrane protein
MRAHSERGVVVIVVAVALLALTVFTGIVVDSGIMWIARGQAQNAADAAALAGALAHVYADAVPPQEVAKAFAAQNSIWGVAVPPGNVILSNGCPPPDPSPNCVAVDVYRDGIPTTFMSLIGITSQDARAHAVAKFSMFPQRAWLIR